MRFSFSPTSGTGFRSQVRSTRRRERPDRARRLLTCEGLEGRALLTASGLDPTFNGGLPILTPTVASSATGLDTVDAVGVQSNGQVVVVGRINVVGQLAGQGLAVRRYNTDGSLDTTFGTNGETDIPLPGGASASATPLPGVLIQVDGRITLAASTVTDTGGTAGGSGILVARLTRTGALDPTFGTNGESTPVLQSHSSYSTIAQLTDGRIALGGSTFVFPADGFGYNEPTISVLTTSGAIDPTFHSGQPLNLDPATYGNSGAKAAEYINLVVTPQGKIAVAYRPSDNGVTTYDERVAEFNGDGTLNTSFGTGGILDAPGSNGGFVDFGAIAVDPRDGSLVLAVASGDAAHGRLVRFTATGQADSSFANPVVTSIYAALAVDAQGRILVQYAGAIGNIDGSSFNVAVQRYLPTGAIDTTFGPDGQVRYNFAKIPGATQTQFSLAGTSGSSPSGLAVTPTGQVIVAGTNRGFVTPTSSTSSGLSGSQGAIIRIRAANSLYGGNNDYDGDNKTDLAAALTALGVLAYRKSTGGDVVQPFGIPGVGQTIPAAGDYDGDGKTDVAAYLPALGILAYRPSSGGSDVYTRFGPTGLGNAIPVPGDYDGDGKTDVALFLPASATFIIDPSSGKAPYAVQYGAAGAGQTIPVPGDYDGDGTTDLAVYVPALGEFFRRLTTDPTTANTGIAFGSAGVGASIPAPADYLGTGRTQFAVYLPANATFAVMVSSGSFNANYAVRFGAAGAGASIPAPGDYDGDGKADFAVYLPAAASFAYRPSSGGGDVFAQFGVAGAGQTTPTAALPIPSPSTVQAMSLSSGASSAQAAVVVPLVDIALDPTPTTRKKTAQS